MTVVATRSIVDFAVVQIIRSVSDNLHVLFTDGSNDAILVCGIVRFIGSPSTTVRTLGNNKIVLAQRGATSGPTGSGPKRRRLTARVDNHDEGML